jgi:hypothetical protein
MTAQSAPPQQRRREGAIVTFISTPPRQGARRLATASATAVFLGLRQTERGFQQQVVKYAKLMGWSCWYVTDSRHSPAGWPDLVMTRRPRVVFAELKSERGKLTADQRACIDELRACGQEAYIFRPSHWESIEKLLR